MCIEAIVSVPENNKVECPLARYVKKYEFTLKIKNIKQNKQHSTGKWYSTQLLLFDFRDKMVMLNFCLCDKRIYCIKYLSLILKQIYIIL